MRLIFVSTSQFGYNSDIYYLAKYLSKYNSVSVLCWDYGNPKIELVGVKVTYIDRAGSKLARYFSFLSGIVCFLNKNNFDIAIVKYFPLVSVVKFFARDVRFLLDVRTATVSGGFISRYIKDCILKVESLFFKYKSIISVGLQKRLNFPCDSYILPLGAEDLSKCKKNKNSKSINLLYVGTLDGRDVVKTIEGLRMCIDRAASLPISFKYYIVGTGSSSVISNLKYAIEKNKLGNVVEIVGYIHHTQLSPYIDIADVGVSFVPITNYFHDQPVTKTYEYLLSGIPVIATRTRENEKIVSQTNGVLIDDNEFSFAQGVYEISLRLINNEISIDKKLYENYDWNFISSNFYGFLKTILNEQ